MAGHELPPPHNFSSCWRDGRLFCAILHRYRPDVLDWAAVHHTATATAVWENCSLAFNTADQLGIPALLDPQALQSQL